MGADRRVAALAIALALAAGCASDGSGSGEPAPAAADPPATTVVPGDASPVPSAGCEAGRPAPRPGTSDHVLRSGGRQRQYQVVIPDDYDGSAPFPVVLGLHSLTVSHRFVAGGAGFADLDEEYDFLTVLPAGLTEPTPYWLAVPVEPNPDLVFIADLLDRVGADLCIDTGRVFSTGLSNGGHMSSLLACRLPDRITAVAPIAGAEFSDRCAGTPVPVMAFHGAADDIVPYAGGGLDAATIADQNLWQGAVPAGVPDHRGVDDAMATWAANNGCAPEPDEERVSPEVVRRTWRDCDAATVLYVVEGGGHNWPGHPVPGFEDMFGHTTTDIDATALMLEFFLGPQQ